MILPLLLTVALYWRGARRMRPGPIPRMHVVAFALGCLAIAIALTSPGDEIADELFTAHMIQHELLMAVAAPLLVLGKPGLVMLWALPAGGRRRVGRVIASRPMRAAWRAAVRPFDAWLLHAVAIWLWHAPVLFEAALEHEAVHALQHVSFLGSGLVFWWAVLHPRRTVGLGLSVLMLFTTALHTAALGALLATSHTVWYPSYAAGQPSWNLTGIQDQQLAGLVMWIPGGVVYLIAALAVFRRWFHSSAWRAGLNETAQEMRVV